MPAKDLRSIEIALRLRDDAYAQFRDTALDVLHEGYTRERGRALRSSFAAAPLAIGSLFGKFALRKVLAVMPNWLSMAVGMPNLGTVKFGDLGGTKPIGEVFGGNRGKCIDRYYIENYLAENADCIRGRVLEIEDNTYTLRFGGAAVAKSDVLHLYEGYPGATIFGDMTDPKTLPENAFDCIVFTQTLHIIYDMKAALRALYRTLKPGGTLLLTVPGITPVDPGGWNDAWCWSLTESAARRLIAEEFGAANVTCKTYGNVFAAVCFLVGLATEEVPKAKLDVYDKAFPLVTGVRAVKPAVL